MPGIKPLNDSTEEVYVPFVNKLTEANNTRGKSATGPEEPTPIVPVSHRQSPKHRKHRRAKPAEPEAPKPSEQEAPIPATPEAPVKTAEPELKPAPETPVPEVKPEIPPQRQYSRHLGSGAGIWPANQRAGHRTHILNIIRGDFKVKNLSQVTKEMARETFEKRDLWRSMVDLDAQRRMDERIPAIPG